MATGPLVILILKIAVIAVTLLLMASLVALVRGRYRLHGQINLAFFILTVIAVLGLEVIIRFLDPSVFTYIRSEPQLAAALSVHLCFSVPSAIMLPFLLWTGKSHRGRFHLGLAICFLILWTGTLVTGIALPHTPAP